MRFYRTRREVPTAASARTLLQGQLYLHDGWSDAYGSEVKGAVPKASERSGDP